MTGRQLGVTGLVACALAITVAVVSQLLAGQPVSRHTATKASPSASPGVVPPPGSPTPSAPGSTAPRTDAPPTGPPPPSPHHPATKPSPTAGATYGAISRTGTAGVSLTFDDGPTWVYTRDLLALLRQHGVKATFCVLGKQAVTYPQRIREIVRDGHSLCNHSYDHDFALGTRSEAEIRANLLRANEAIHRAVPGTAISYFRHPGGNWTPRAVKVAAELGMTSIHWDVDPQDWRRPGASAIASYVTSHTKRGSIVLLHDGGGDRDETIEACRRMLPSLKSRYQLVRMPPRAAP